MKLVKYIFTIPFSPKKKWKEAIKLLDNSANIKEDVLLLFLITSFIPISVTLIFKTEWYGIENIIRQVLVNYVSILFKFVLLYFGMILFGSILKVNKIPKFKLVSILLLTFCLVNLSHILLNEYFYFDDFVYYMPWYYFALKMGINLMGAYILVVGLLECSETNFKSHDMKKNYANVILFFIAINGINYLYSMLYSILIYRMFYAYIY